MGNVGSRSIGKTAARLPRPRDKLIKIGAKVVRHARDGATGSEKRRLRALLRPHLGQRTPLLRPPRNRADRRFGWFRAVFGTACELRRETPTFTERTTNLKWPDDGVGEGQKGNVGLSWLDASFFLRRTDQ